MAWDIGAFEVPTPAVNYSLTAANGSFTETGKAALFRYGKKLTSANGTFTESGQIANLHHGYNLTASNTSFAETGQVVNLRNNKVFLISNGSYTETGEPATLHLQRNYILVALNGSYSETGISLLFIVSRHLATSVAHYSLTAENAHLSYIPFGSTPEWKYTGITRVSSYIAAERSITCVAAERIIKG